MGKRAKKRWKARGTPRARIIPLRELVVLPKRGRPKRDGDVGPTPQTLAKLPIDILDALVKARILSEEQAVAGREIVDAWDFIVAKVGYPAASMGTVPGRTHTNSKRVDRLLAVWVPWANEMPKRTHVRCFVPVEWIMGHRRCDMHEKGDAGVLKAALQWWLKASEDVGRASASEHRHPAKTQPAAQYSY